MLARRVAASERSSSRLRDWNFSGVTRARQNISSERSSSRLRDWNHSSGLSGFWCVRSERSSSRLRDWNTRRLRIGIHPERPSERSSSRLRDWNISAPPQGCQSRAVRTLIIPTEGLEHYYRYRIVGRVKVRTLIIPTEGLERANLRSTRRRSHRQNAHHPD